MALAQGLRLAGATGGIQQQRQVVCGQPGAASGHRARHLRAFAQAQAAPPCRLHHGQQFGRQRSLLGRQIDDIDTAIDKVNSKRATLGATQSCFDAVISNLQASVENQSAARSRIVDADFAAETANLSRSQVLQQAGNAMVAQAKQLPQQVLSMLR
jgi:flagellin-like hook-associated protein FlgL